jgi:hypothetical protein
MKSFVDRVLLLDPNTLTEVKTLWGKARENGLNEEYLCAWIDSMAMEMDRSQQLNFMRWNILNSKEHMNPVARGSYASEVAYLKEYITKRIEWMDKKLGYVYTAVEDVVSSDTYYRVWDILGRIIYQGESLPALDRGVYVIQHNGVIKTKMIIE